MPLYHLYDFQRAALAPLRLGAETIQHFFSHPLVPMSYTRFGRAVAAGAELLERSTRRYGKPEFGLSTTTVDGAEIGIRVTTAMSRPFGDLLHFRRDVERDDPRVLVVAPMSHRGSPGTPRRPAHRHLPHPGRRPGRPAHRLLPGPGL